VDAEALAALQRRVLALKAARVGVSLGLKPGPLSLLFTEQADLARDPSKFKVALCGRRAGKTLAAVCDLAQGMLDTPGSANLYVALTIGSALKIFWKPFRQLNEKHKWGFKLNEATHEIRHPNGSWLVVAGGDTRADLEKYRGTPWARVRIDECGSWRPSYLHYFVEEVLEPSFMDFGGDLWLMGTPTRQAWGFFHDACTGKLPGYSVHRWTAAVNPHVDWQGFVHGKLGLLARRGWTEENTIFKREYLAIWSVDPEELVYAFNRNRCLVDALPPHKHGYDYVVGVDYGVNNACAYSVIASPRKVGNTIYTVEVFRRHGMAPSEFADVLNELFERVRPWKIVGDLGGLGKGFWKEYTVRYTNGWPILPANKQDRRGTIEIVSDMLLTGRKLSLRANEPLHSEWATLQWDEDRENTADGQDNDVSDADMYASKECPAFLQRDRDEPEAELPTYLTRDEQDEPPARSYLWAPEE
jgi:hypothetical protein